MLRVDGGVANKTTVTRRLRTLQIFLYLVVGISLFFSHPQQTQGMEFEVGVIDLPTNYPLTTEMKIKPIKPKPVQTNCQCVPYIKALLGITESIGAAKNWEPNTQIPTIGAVVITVESSLGHVGLVTDIQDGYLIISEKNFTPCTVTHGRRLSVNSPVVIGYWIP